MPSPKLLIGALSQLRDALYGSVVGRSGAIEHGVAILPTGAKVGPLRGTSEGVDLRKSKAWQKFLQDYANKGGANVRDELPDELWGTAHTHPPESAASWLDNGPSHDDLIWAANLPRGDHQVVHQGPMVQEFFSVPSSVELKKFASDVTGTDNQQRALIELLNPRGYVPRISGAPLPPEFNGDYLGLSSRAIQNSLADRGLIGLTNTGTERDNEILKEAIEAVRKRIPFKDGGGV